jgi:DNA-binding winged helix-turn-helix (wHTH) protein
MREPGDRVRFWRFGSFEADAETGELRKRGVRVHLQAQPFQVLTVLLARAGQLVTREELRRQVWPENTFVEFDYALNTAVKKIRIALRDDPCLPRFVATVPRRGYTFIAGVEAHTEAERRIAVKVTPRRPPGLVAALSAMWSRFITGFARSSR